MTISIATSVVVVGASLGGVLAAASAAAEIQRGNITQPVMPQVILLAEHDWLGGQMTAQGVPPDEHKFIEHGGASASYLAFRDAMRAHYLGNPEFIDNTEMTEGCNPGDGWVSRLCFEPAIAAAYFETLLAPYLDAGVLAIFRGAKLALATRSADGKKIAKIDMVQGLKTTTIIASTFIDATDTGELILHAGLRYRLGKEASSEFNEPDAPLAAASRDQQPVTLVMALKRCNASQAAVPKPAAYDFWAAYVLPHYNYKLFSNNLPGHGCGQAMQLPFFGFGQTLDLWRYRRVISARNWRHNALAKSAAPKEEISLINWAQNDYGLQPLLDDGADQADVYAAARALSLCLLYWLQTAAVREDGGIGYDNLALAPEALGTKDGFAQQIYVRESRRIVGYKCLSQADVLADGSNDLEPTFCSDSIAAGWYNMDIHPTVESGHGVNAKVRPFEIPLGCLVPLDCDNFISACKNISVTHLVNAATRVHPIEWAIGEAAGVLAAHSAAARVTAGEIAQSPTAILRVQQALTRIGGHLHWDAGALQRVLGPQQIKP